MEYGLLMGASNSGKTTLAKVMMTKLDFKVIDMKAIADQIRSGMKNEEGEPVEPDTEVPIAEVEKVILSMIQDSKS